MNLLLAKFLNYVYKKEPFSGFIILLGLTDTLIGSFNGRSSLLSFGLLILVMGIIARIRQLEKEKSKIKAPQKQIRYRLPAHSSNVPLPLLTSNKNRR